MDEANLDRLIAENVHSERVVGFKKELMELLRREVNLPGEVQLDKPKMPKEK